MRLLNMILLRWSLLWMSILLGIPNFYSRYLEMENVTHLNLDRVEQHLREFEHHNWMAAISDVKAASGHVRGFYHVSSWQPFWREVIQEQVLLMVGKRGKNKEFVSSSVFDIIDVLSITVSGNEQEQHEMDDFFNTLFNVKRFARKVQYVHNRTIGRGDYAHANEEQRHFYESQDDLSSGEIATLLRMQEYCTSTSNTGTPSYVFYVHNKGSCCTHENVRHPNDECVADWRELMDTFALEFPSICLRALLDGYSTCGVAFQQGIYVGNFYWANCAHITSLGKPNRFLPYDAEPFLFNVTSDGFGDQKTLFGNNCGYNPFHCGVNMYIERCPRAKYRPILMHTLGSVVKQGTLPPNPTATTTDTKEVLGTCARLREGGPYDKQPFWSDWKAFPFKPPAEGE